MIGVAIVAFSWLWLQWTHEAGHVIAGLVTGGEIERVVLDPRTFSRTDFASNPSPLITVWGGPVIGCLLGAGLPHLVSCRLRDRRAIGMLIAAAVLLGNGAYIGLGAVFPVGDAEVMRDAGTPAWALAVFGVACVLPARMLAARSITSIRASEHRWASAAPTLGVLTGAMAIAGWLFFHA